MNVYESEHVRNLAVIGHGASGKTTLVNAMAWLAGSCSRMGSVEDGTSLTDFTPDETEHQISISLAMAYAEFMDTKVNLIDTPGYLDFAGEVVSGLRVADSACLVVNAVAGVEVGTERVWEYAEAEKLPRMIFINPGRDPDRAGIRFSRHLQFVQRERAPLPGWRDRQARDREDPG
jgi:elongation factor G